MTEREREKKRETVIEKDIKRRERDTVRERETEREREREKGDSRLKKF